MEVTHLVRRYGLVGGMESYVWNLTHALVELGVTVRVLSETLEGDPNPQIVVEQLPKPDFEKPRWKAIQHFSDQVTQRALVGDLGVVHSHERSAVHQVTSFHGPPIGELLINGPWWKRLQPRVAAWGRLERREVCGPGVEAVIPVSHRLGQLLSSLYPEVQETLAKQPGWPGLDPFCVKENRGDGQRLVFVGREWKRKGLDIVLRAFEKVRQRNPNVSLDVFGIEKRDLPHSLQRIASAVVFHGWKAAVDFEEYDVLLHPARKEPFGMVIPEARSAGLTVVTSDQVGATDLGLSPVLVLPVESPVERWVEAVVRALELPKEPSEVRWTWNDLASWHVDCVYGPILQKKGFTGIND